MEVEVVTEEEWMEMDAALERACKSSSPKSALDSIDLKETLIFLERKDPALSVVFRELKDLDISTFRRSPYVALIGGIIGQIISLDKARKIRGNLFSLIGTSFTRSEVEALSDGQLLGCGMDAQKIRIVRSVNQFLEKNRLELTDKESVLQLCRVPGIGEWTVNVTLLVSMLDLDLFPGNDVFLQGRLMKLYRLPKRPTPREVERMSDLWRPYRGVVCWYLWRWF